MFRSVSSIRRIALPIVVGVLLLCSADSYARDSIRELSEAFRSAIEKVKPAVVSISAEKKMQRLRNQLSPDGRNAPNPNERNMEEIPELFKKFFGDELFRRGNIIPKRDWQGSGVIISPDGDILTNNHVVEGADKLTITLDDGREVKVDIKNILTDPGSDIALIRMKDNGSYPYAELGDSDALQVGDWVLAIGSPFGLNQSVSEGIVSAKGRTSTDVPIGGQSFFLKDYIQTTAAINPGNSGGPLINLDGEIIGINNAIQTAGIPGNLGIGFAIPSKLAKNVVDSLIEFGKVKRGYIGVYLEAEGSDLLRYYREKYEISYGAVIKRVNPDTPADKAGLEARDMIIIVEGEKVQNSGHLINLVTSNPVGSDVELTIIRNGKRLSKTLTLAERPGEKELASAFMTLSEGLLGMQVETLTSEVAKNIGVEKDLKGVIVTAVAPGSSAYEGKIQKNDIITEIEDIAIESVDDLEKVLTDIKQKMIEKGNDEKLIMLRKYSPGRKYPEEWVALEITLTEDDLKKKEED